MVFLWYFYGIFIQLYSVILSCIKLYLVVFGCIKLYSDVSLRENSSA